MPQSELSAMGRPMSQDAQKKAVARAALAYLPEEGVVGLGSGSTAKYFIDEVGALVAQGRKLLAVPTSEQSRIQAEALGIPLAPSDGPWDIDVTVDGADEVSDTLDLIKGGGAAHTREKIVNFASSKNVIVVDESKISTRLGEKWSVPIEVLSFAHLTTARALRAWGALTLRSKDGKPVRTDSGHFIYDLAAGPIDDPAELDRKLRAVPGVVETGLFCGRADIVLVATPTGVRELRRTREQAS
jgi:ribose 5-phosphate isomerase A